ncbi:unnamed protein product [Prorocentrum cordatum]|uniref:Uncharacterized protein n=1 Tax=Prorocentrum cordatum TaxID=2364126 RepID=A0ABN9W6Q2_9DINO|nr:unnamed protein product [Polarella glacialis]
MALPDGTVGFLVPGFLRLIRELHEGGREFSVAFRTFGSDLPAVARDWNRFCDGQHPLHPGFELPGRRLDLCQKDSFGYLWRGGFTWTDEGTQVEQIALVLGTSELAPGTNSQGWGTTSAQAALEWYEAMGPNRGEILRGTAAIQQFFDEAASAGRTVGTRECYPHWASCSWKTGGKLHFVDTARPPQYHALFLDDNIGKRGIIDIRATRSVDNAAHVMTPEEALGAYMVSVEPLRVMSDDAYLANKVAEAEAELDRRIAANIDP